MPEPLPIFESQNQTELFFWGFWEGYWLHMAENVEVVVSVLGGQS